MRFCPSLLSQARSPHPHPWALGAEVDSRSVHGLAAAVRSGPGSRQTGGVATGPKEGRTAGGVGEKGWKLGHGILRWEDWQTASKIRRR